MCAADAAQTEKVHDFFVEKRRDISHLSVSSTLIHDCYAAT